MRPPVMSLTAQISVTATDRRRRPCSQQGIAHATDSSCESPSHRPTPPTAEPSRRSAPRQRAADPDRSRADDRKTPQGVPPCSVSTTQSSRRRGATARIGRRVPRPGAGDQSRRLASRVARHRALFKPWPTTRTDASDEWKARDTAAVKAGPADACPHRDRHRPAGARSQQELACPVPVTRQADHGTAAVDGRDGTPPGPAVQAPAAQGSTNLSAKPRSR